MVMELCIKAAPIHLANMLTDADRHWIKARLKDRGVSSYETSAWIDLWHTSHYDQAQLLRGMRREWSIKLPRATEEDVTQARAVYCGKVRYLLTYCNSLESAPRPLTKLQQTFADALEDHHGLAKIKPATVKEYLKDNRNEAYRDYGTSVYVAEMCSAYNAIKQTQDNTRRTIDATLVCSIRPDAFLGLGEFKPCKDRGSCYRVGGEYQTSPVIIGGGSDSVVWFLRDADDTCIARAFGTLTESGGYAQNFYHIGKDKTALHRAISIALGVDPMPTRVYLNDACYSNRDAIAWGDHVSIGDEVTDDNIVSTCTCSRCDCACDPDETISLDNGDIIGRCCEDSYVYSEHYNEYIDAEDAVYVEESDTWVNSDDDNLHCSIEGTYFLCR